MLVIFSDTHLTDGTSGKTVKAGAFRVFRDRLCELAYEASWRKDGTYEPIQELTLLLMGDIFDAIRSTQWLETPNLRPWSNSDDSAFIQVVNLLTDAILKHNAAAFAILKSMSGENQVNVPKAGPNVQKDSRERQPVKVHIHYMIGNHDWFYHLPSKAYNPARLRIVQALGLDSSHASGDAFPHRIEDSGAGPIRRVCEEHHLYARHGDIYDPVNFDGDRNKSSLGDALVVELIERFTVTVARDFGNRLSKDSLEGLNEIDNLRPYTVIPTWICAWLKETCPDAQVKRQIKRMWSDLVHEFFKLDYVRQQLSLHHSFADRKRLLSFFVFHVGFKISTLITLPRFESVLALLARWVGTMDSAPSYKDAGQEPALKNREATYVTFGHTHQYDFVPLRVPTKDLNISGGQVYFNSGTWRPYHELTRLHPTKEEFVGYEVMSYVAFYKGNERGGRPYETWSGVLAPD
jgi:UDP-2,3-diacylglucosamine pyrophosphatase LpxH